jgi:alpha-beta hydrolase superfamily lysophospholipase
MISQLKIIILVLIGGYIVASLLLYLLQERFIFLGEPLRTDHRFDFDTPFTEINIDAEDGGMINTIHFHVENPKGLIVYYHGNAGNLAGWGYVASNFTQLGYEVAIMDYRGYGKSTGKRTEKTMLSDALVVYDHFKKDVPEDKLVLYGRSLGTGIAAYVASERNPSKIILETPYYNFTSLVQAHVPVFPAAPSLKYKFNTYRYLKSSQCPVYIFHGTEDRVVPFKHGNRLYESLDEEQATMYIIEGGTHNDLDNYKEYWVNLEKILK